MDQGSQDAFRRKVSEALRHSKPLQVAGLGEGW